MWKPGAKSLLIDSVVRGIPTPVIFVRDRLDLDSLKTVREVVDGQQRLRTLLSFIDQQSLPDFNAERDRFTVLAAHNKAIAGKKFSALDNGYKTRILDYQFTTHTLPSSMEDHDVLQLFARLNSTGTRLNKQELRNAEFFGPFKSLMYDLAYEQLERWRSWRIFNEDAIARMREVELTSDLAMTILQGATTGKTQTRLNRLYKTYDDTFPAEKAVQRRFGRQWTRSTRSSVIRSLAQSSRAKSLFTLFTYMYDRLYGLGSEMELKLEPRPIGDIAKLFATASTDSDQNVPSEVLDAGPTRERGHRTPGDTTQVSHRRLWQLGETPGCRRCGFPRARDGALHRSS